MFVGKISSTLNILIAFNKHIYDSFDENIIEAKNKLNTFDILKEFLSLFFQFI